MEIADLHLNPDKLYLVSPYGLGDTMFLCGFREAIQARYNAPVHLLLKHAHGCIPSMYGISDFTLVKTDDFFKQKGGNGLQVSKRLKPGEIFIAHPEFSGDYKKDLKPLDDLELDIIDIYKRFLQLPDEANLEQPNNMPKMTHQILQTIQKIAPLEKITLFLPEAKSEKMLPMAFWENLALQQQKMGFTVITNSLSEQTNIDHTVQIQMSLYDCIALALNCKSVYAMRSGLCDLINQKGRNLNVFYSSSPSLFLYNLNRVHNHNDINESVINPYAAIVKSKPAVTVITPILNLVKSDRLESFKRCMASIKKQNYSNLEHLIIDGASTDGTLEFLKEHAKHGKVRVVSRKDNGIYEAMNLGIHEAKGKYINFMNSDDRFHDRDAIRRSIDALEANDADFSFGTVNMENGPAEIRYVFHPNEQQFITAMPFSHQSMFCKRSVLMKESFDTELGMAADLDLIIRLYLGGFKSVVIQHVIATYSMNGLSGSNQAQCFSEYKNVYKKNYAAFNLRDKELNGMAYKNITPARLRKAISEIIRFKNPEMHKRLFPTGGRLSYRVFGLPIVTVTNEPPVKFFKCLRLPILKIKTTSWKKKYYLFNFFPIFEKFEY